MVNRKSTAAAASVPALKTGDIVWVPYRKSPKWPAVIKNVYPKKLTYFFLPEAPRAPTFKTTPKSVVLFKETDTIPNDASKDLQEAYKAALQLIRGEIQLKHMTTPTNHRGKRSQSSSPSTSNNSVDEPVQKKARRNTESNSESEFSRLTVVLVDKAEAQKWPALLTDVSDRNLAVRHFPLADNPKTTSYPYSRVHNVTYDDIGELIASHDRKAPEYVRALVAAEEFIEHPSNHIDIPAGFVLTQKVSEVRGSRKVKQQQQPVSTTTSPVSRPKAKAVFKTTRASAAAAAAAAAASSAQPIASSSSEIMTRSGTSKLGTASPTKPAPINDLPKDSAHSNGLNIGGLSLVNSLLKAMVSMDAQEYMKKVWAKKVACPRHAAYERITSTADAYISMNIGDLLEFHDLQLFIVEVQDWIKLSPKLPKMSAFEELHFISKVVLPELLVYGLQKVRKISPAEAEQVLAEAIDTKPAPKSVTVVMESPPKAEPAAAARGEEAADVDVTSYDDLPQESEDTGFHCLLRAASIERKSSKI